MVNFYRKSPINTHKVPLLGGFLAEFFDVDQSGGGRRVRRLVCLCDMLGVSARRRCPVLFAVLLEPVPCTLCGRYGIRRNMSSVRWKDSRAVDRCKIPAATSSATVDLTGSEPLLTEMDVHEGVGRWVYSGGLVVSSDGTWRPEEGGASDDGPSFAEMMGLGEDQSVFALEEGGFLITGPGHDMKGGQIVMPLDPPGFIKDVDKFGACIWRDHPALQKSFFALMGLDMDQPRAIVKKMSQVANLTGNLETLAMSLTDEVKKGRILSKASDINCRQAVALCCVKNFSAAVTSARLALDLAERAGDEQGQAFALSTLGDALDSSGQYNKSIEAYEKRIAIAEKLEDVDGHEF